MMLIQSYKNHQMKHLKLVNFNKADLKCTYSSIYPWAYWIRIEGGWSPGTDGFRVFDTGSQAADKHLNHQPPTLQLARNVNIIIIYYSPHVSLLLKENLEAK